MLVNFPFPDPFPSPTLLFVDDLWSTVLANKSILNKVFSYNVSSVVSLQSFQEKFSDILGLMSPSSAAILVSSSVEESDQSEDSEYEEIITSNIPNCRVFTSYPGLENSVPSPLFELYPSRFFLSITGVDSEAPILEFLKYKQIESYTVFYSGEYCGKLAARIKPELQTPDVAVVVLDRRMDSYPLFASTDSLLDRAFKESKSLVLADYEFIKSELSPQRDALLKKIQNMFSTNKSIEEIVKMWNSTKEHHKYESQHPSISAICGSLDAEQLVSFQSAIDDGAELADILECATQEDAFNLIGYCNSVSDINLMDYQSYLTPEQLATLKEYTPNSKDRIISLIEPFFNPDAPDHPDLISTTQQKRVFRGSKSLSISQANTLVLFIMHGISFYELKNITELIEKAVGKTVIVVNVLC